MQLVMQRLREVAPHGAQCNTGLLSACFALGKWLDSGGSAAVAAGLAQ
nr:hypothetical protein [Pseudomonas brenneri]